MLCDGICATARLRVHANTQRAVVEQGTNGSSSSHDSRSLCSVRLGRRQRPSTGRREVGSSNRSHTLTCILRQSLD